MRIIFLNSMEKRRFSDGRQADSAQVWIGEEQGVWRLGWTELPDEDEHESLWYEGGSWSEMLYVYRHRLSAKLGEGYRPVIDGIFHEREESRNKAAAAMKLAFYSETHPNELLFTELCSWRRRRAASERKAPYLIASNRLLRLISVFQPKTLEELLQLPGVGESKSSEYGAEILELSAQGDRKHEYPLSWVDGLIDDEEFRSWLYKQKEMKYRAEMERYEQRRQVLDLIAEGLGLEEMALRTELSRRDLVELLEDLEKEGSSTDTLLRSELKETPNSEFALIWQAYEELGDTFLKPILQRVYGSELPPDSNVELLYEKLRLIRIQYRRTLRGQGVRSAG